MAWLILAFAIVTEVIATTALRYTEGFTKIIPTGVMLLCYGLSFFALSKILNDIPLAITYAIWSGAGISLVAVIGWLWLGQKLDAGALIGISFIVAGVIIINLFSTSITH